MGVVTRYITTMAPQLRTEIKQQKPFASLEQEAHLNLERTAAVLVHALAEAMKPYDITPTQYNVLRILRGAGAAGLSRNEVRDRMVAQVPDVTRLMDRLEGQGLIDRQRGTEDRRQVASRITAKGLALLDTLDQPVLEIHRRQLGHMTEEQLRTLVDLLQLARAPSCESQK